MSSFTEPLFLTVHNGRWETGRPLQYEIGKKGSGLVVIVPPGHQTDLASIPRWLWWLLAPHDPRYSPAAVLHDWLTEWPEFNRRVADSIFLEAMGVLGVPVWKRTLMYLGVRLKAFSVGA